MEKTAVRIRRERIVWLDMARTIAIILVVWNHAVELIYNFDLPGWDACPAVINIAKILFFSIGRLGVPIFLSISGVLILQKRMDTANDMVCFWKHNLLPLVLTVEIWHVIYFVFQYWQYGTLNWEEVWKTMLFLQTASMMNMWYMPMIIGMYIALPFVAYLLQHLTERVLLFPMCMALISAILLPSLNVILNSLQIDALSLKIDLSFLGAVYGLYIVCGYFVGKGAIKSIPTMWIVVIFGLIMGITVAVQYWANEHGYNYYTWYNFAGTFADGLLLFEMLRRTEALRFPKAVQAVFRYVVKISLALFFVHMPILLLLQPYVAVLKTGYAYKTMLLWSAACLASIVFISLLSLLKPLRKTVFLIKY